MFCTRPFPAWMAAAGLGLAALALAGLAGGARADGHCGNATMASVAQSVPDLSTLVGVVTSVSEDASQAKTAEPFLDAIQDPSTANVTAFAPVNSAFEPLANATFHAAAEAMEEGEGYDTLAGAAAGQLTINGDEVEDDSGNDGGEESADDGGDDGDGEDAD